MCLHQTFLNETFRLLKNKKIWMLIGVMLLLNGVIIVINDSKGDVVPAEYKQIKQQILDMDAASQIEILEDLAWQDEADMMQADGSYEFRNTASIQLLDEFNTISGYQEYLDKIQTEAQKNQNIPIFASSKFAKNNLKRTAKDYLPLASVSPALVGGYGLSRMLSGHISTVCILFIMAVLVMYSILEEKKTGVLELYQSAPNGRDTLCLSKIFSIVLIIAVVTLVFYIENIGYAFYAYGMVDLAAPLQSLYGYDQCVLRISVGQFLVCNLFLQWLSLILVGLLMFVFASLMQNEIFYYIAVGLIFLVELLIYNIGRHIGKLSFLQYFNIFSFLQTENFFTYHNYNFFGWPFHLLETNLTGILVLCMIFMLSGVFAFTKYACNYKALSFKHFFARKHFSPKLWSLENYKMLYGNKVVLFILIAVLFQTAVYSGKTAKWYGDELVFRYYIKQIEGEVTAEKLDYIQGEKERYEELHARYYAYEEQLDKNEISESEFIRKTQNLSLELQKESGFLMAEQYVNYIQELDCEDKGIVYDRGWWYLAGSGRFNNDIKNGILLVVCLILALSGVFAQEYQYRMQSLIHIGKERNSSVICKIGITALLVTLIFILVYVPELLWVVKEYDLKGGSWSVYSLMFLNHFPVNCSITGYFLIIYLVRYITAFFIGGCIVLLSKILKNTNLTIIVAAIIFLLPLLLHMMNVEFIDVCSLNKLISGNMLF